MKREVMMNGLKYGFLYLILLFSFIYYIWNNGVGGVIIMNDFEYGYIIGMFFMICLDMVCELIQQYVDMKYRKIEVG